MSRYTLNFFEALILTGFVIVTVEITHYYWKPDIPEATVFYVGLAIIIMAIIWRHIDARRDMKERRLKGTVMMAAPSDNSFGSMIALRFDPLHRTFRVDEGPDSVTCRTLPVTAHVEMIVRRGADGTWYARNIKRVPIER